MVAMHDPAGTIDEAREVETCSEPRRQSFCAVPLKNVVYAGPRSREEFDRLPIEETVHAWQPAEVEALLRNDGQRYEQRCHSKAFESQSGLTVIFQWFDYRVAEAPAGGDA